MVTGSKRNYVSLRNATKVLSKITLALISHAIKKPYLKINLQRVISFTTTFDNGYLSISRGLAYDEGYTSVNIRK